MLIIDDRLTFRVLRGSYNWLPAGHDPSELATTIAYYYRLIIGTLREEPLGVHSSALAELTQTERTQVIARLRYPEPLVTILDPRTSIHTAAAVAVHTGRLSHLQAEAIAAALADEAALAVTALSPGFAAACTSYGLTLHHIELTG